jgi:AsmA protein
MRRWLRFGLFGVGGLVLAAVVAGGLFVATFDPNSQKDRIVDAVRRATGRELVLAGPLKLSMGWTPSLEAEDAALSNRAGGSRPQMATVARLQASVALMPLLSGQIEIESVTLDRPDILLETDAQGIGNWQFQRPVSDAAPGTPAAASAPREKAVVAVHQLLVKNGRLTWRNEASGRVTIVDVPQATITLNKNEASLAADAQTSGQAVHLDALMVTDGAGPWPIKASMDAAGAHVALDGAVLLPLNTASYRGKLDAAIPDLAALGAILKIADLPKLRDMRVGMQIADGVPQDVTLHLGSSDLAAYLPGTSVAHLDLTMPALGQSGRVTGDGAMPGGPWRLSSGFLISRQTLALRGLSLATPGADVSGDVAVSRNDRFALRGTVLSQRVDVDWLRSLRRTESPPAAASPVSVTPAPPPPRMVFSDAKLPWDRLRAADADLQFSIAMLHVAGSDYHGVAGHLALLDGALRLDPLSIQAPEGRIDGSLVADASQPEPPVAVVLRSAAFGLDPLLQLAGLPGGSDAPVELDVALTSAGQSWHGLASRLNGHAGLAMVDGTVSNAALAAAIGGLVPKGAGRLDPAGRSAVRCLAVRMDAAAGQVTIAALDLDTSRLDLTGAGTLNLADETMALRLRPTVRVGGAGILAPVKIDGSLAHPAAALDSQGIEGRAGIVIGGAAPPDTCPASLALARDGHAGRMPAPAAVKTPKAADLLRSFLR